MKLTVHRLNLMLLAILLVCGLALVPSLASAAEVSIMATPDDGLQPRLVTDAGGGIHLLYFKKRLNRPAAREGSLYYRQYDAEAGRFGAPVRVSSQAFNVQSYAIARASLAIDGQGRAHVMWYLPRSSVYYYTRSNPQRSAFEPQRSMVSEFDIGLDASGDVAAHGDQVALIWAAGDLSFEERRAAYGRFSHDGGETFGSEMLISNPDLGACACCSLAADYQDDSQLLVAYRSAIDGVGRHMQLLTVDGVDNAPSGSRYGPVHKLQQWEASFCPLSTNDISTDHEGGNWLVFETEARIMLMGLPDQTPMPVAAPFTETRQKHPAVAVNPKGETLVVWGEAISHTRGGRLNMQLLTDGQAVSGFEFAEQIEIGDFSFPAAAVLPDGNFLVVY